LPAAIVVRTLGGTVGNFHSRVEETPVFHPGEEPARAWLVAGNVSHRPRYTNQRGNRTGLRVLYPDPADTLHQGSVSGRIIPANPLALPAFPPGVTGVFGSHVVAVDNATGATLGGWSCGASRPVQFDGTYQIAGVLVGRNYTVYAEALNGAASPSQFNNALTSLCRNAMTDAGWPPLQSCIVPSVNISFTTRTRPGPERIPNSNLASRVSFLALQLSALGSAGVSQPPPNSNPGPSDARKMGLR
jgi:hypothetical protein